MYAAWTTAARSDALIRGGSAGAEAISLLLPASNVIPFEPFR
jgi:hypothetical protein